jgi:demethylmenaquinone methyltransferase/2-methoxy-6-polyprenyl-1,4-benzoquinol methylase
MVDQPSATDKTGDGERPLRVRRMFDRIVPRYDLLNRLMSFGMDGGWRRRAAAAAAPAGARVLDLGAGTGDLTRELRRQGASLAIGADFSERMLAAARTKARGEPGLAWVTADALRLPFPDGAFDAVTNAFLLRNLSDLAAGLAEMVRVLRPAGRLVCLDMTQPPENAFGAAYRLYFGRLLPPVAGLISGDRDAYRYLPESLAGFPDAEALAGLLRQAGLIDVTLRPLAGGTVALHRGLKPARP